MHTVSPITCAWFLLIRVNNPFVVRHAVLFTSLFFRLDLSVTREHISDASKRENDQTLPSTISKLSHASSRPNQLQYPT